MFMRVQFGLHMAAAVLVATAWFMRDNQSALVSVMYTDRLTTQVGSPGVWLDPSFNRSCYSIAVVTRECDRYGLPLYDTTVSQGVWHPFALVGCCEAVSAGFALTYLGGHWLFASFIALLGVALYTPQFGACEGVLLWVNAALAVALFAHHSRRNNGPAPVTMPPAYVNPEPTPSAPPLPESQADNIVHESDSVTVTVAVMGLPWVAESLAIATGPAMRMAEAGLTMPPLYVAVLCALVTDPPAFMPLVGYMAMEVCCLAWGMLHLTVIASANEVRLEGQMHLATPPRRCLKMPPMAQMLPTKIKRRQATLLGGDLPGKPVYCEAEMDLPSWWEFPYVKFDWGDSGSFLNNGLLDVWTAYTGSFVLLLYQAVLLTESVTPWAVMASGWLFIIIYIGMGCWTTTIYAAPPNEGGYALLQTGLDVMGLTVKVCVAVFLVFGFASGF